MIWKHLGFGRNIFFVEPLQPYAEDIGLFVARETETKSYLADVLRDTRALKIVSGEVGVGKTSFVNACQYYSYANSLPFDFEFSFPKVLPCFDKIQIRESDTLDIFLHQTITSICQSIVHHCRLNRIEPPGQVKEILSYFLDLAIGVGGKSLSGGVSVLGTGAQVGRSTESKVPNPIRNARVHLRNLVELIRGELDFQGVFVTVNNLDILSKGKLIEFVNVGRDELFDIPGIYWTLIGRTGIGSVIETEAERVADYLSGIELHVNPLGFSETKLVIEKRVEAYRESPDVPCPLTNETIEAFHKLSVQELRETLRICADITTRVLLIDPSLQVIPEDRAISAFTQYAHDRSKDLDLSDSQIRVLSAVFERRACRPKDYVKFGYKSVQGFIVALKGLVSKRLLSVEERGRARIYRVTGMTMIAALTGALGRDLQELPVQQLTGSGKARSIDRNAPDSPQLELQLDDTSGEETASATSE